MTNKFFFPLSVHPTCILIRKLRLLILKSIFERYVLIIAVVLLIFGAVCGIICTLCFSYYSFIGFCDLLQSFLGYSDLFHIADLNTGHIHLG